MKILVVDDEIPIVEELCSLLKRRGHEVAGADGVEAARAAIEGGEAFDLVLTDMRMGPGSGVDVLRLCNRQPDPPAKLIMTGMASAVEIGRALAEGALSILAKPLSLRVLSNALAQVEQDRLRPVAA